MAEKTYLHDLDLNLNQLLNAVLQQLGVDPAAVEGQVWYKTGDKRISYFDGVQNQRVANLNDITGLWSLQGPYNAATNTPDLVTPAAGTVLKGYAYVVTTGGDFYGEELEIGDVIIASVDDPASLNDWLRVQFNLPSNVTKKFDVILDSGDANVTRTFAGGQTSFAVTHGIGSKYVSSNVYNVATDKEVSAEIETTDSNTLTVRGNGNVADGAYRISIIG